MSLLSTNHEGAMHALPKNYEILAPTRLCVRRARTASRCQARWWICRATRSGSPENHPRHVPVVGIHAHDEFGTERLHTAKEEELCVPSEMVPGS